MNGHTITYSDNSGYQHVNPPHSSPPGRNNIPTNIAHTVAPYFNTSDVRQRSYEPSHLLHGSDTAHCEPTNELNQSCAPSVGFSADRDFSYDARYADVAFDPVAQTENGFRRGTQNHTEVSGSGPRDLEEPFPSLSIGSPSQAVHQSSYEPFSGRFHDSESARCHRKAKTRFSRQPYREPESDPSIFEIESNRQYNVARIYNAMTRADVARDNPNSIAMKRWVHSAHYQPDLVEAYAHKVLDCILEQAKEGFRGWHHNDYVVDDRKGEDEDRDVNCAGRLNNIIRALEEEKTICEDVMNSACQIRMFVNAPKAYSNRKHQNRVGNSKRGRTKDGDDTASKPLKTRRTSTRSVARHRSATVSDLGTIPYESPNRRASESPLHGHHSLRLNVHQTVQYTPSPVLTGKAPTMTPQNNILNNHTATRHPSFGQYSTNAISPPAGSFRGQLPMHIPREVSMPLPTHPPFISPSTSSHGHFSAPVTPDAIQLNKAGPSNNWAYGESLDTTLSSNQSLDDLLFPPEWNWANDTPTYNSTGSANFFENYPEAGITLADLEKSPNDHEPTGNLDYTVLSSNFQGSS